MKFIKVFKNETITLSKNEIKDEYWLYDYTRGMNLSMRAKTEQQAFVEALTYYQKRLTQIEGDLKNLQNKVSMFVESVSDNEE